MLERSINTSNHCHEKKFRSNFLLNLKFACCVPVFQRLSTGWVNTAIYYVKGYLRYKTITFQSISPYAQVKNCFIL